MKIKGWFWQSQPFLPDIHYPSASCRSCFLDLSALWTPVHTSSAMSRSVGFNICVVTCCILLLSSSPPCLASPLLEERDMTKTQYGSWAGNGVEDERTSMPNLINKLGPSEQTLSEEPSGVSAKPSGMPLNEVFTAERETQPVSPSRTFLGSQSLDVSTTMPGAVAAAEEELSPTNSELNESEEFKAMLTTAVTTLSPPVQEEPISKATTEDCEVGQSSASLLANLPSVTAATEEIAESSSYPSAAPQPHSEQVPTWQPSTPSLEGASDYLIIPSAQAPSESFEVGTPEVNTGSALRLLASQGATTVNHPLVTTEANLHLGADTGVGQGEQPTAVSTASSLPTDSVPLDWDDTKLGSTSQGGSVQHEEVGEDQVATKASVIPLGDMEEKEDDVTRVLPSPASAPPTPGLAKEINCTTPAAMHGEDMLVTSTASSDVSLTGDLPDVDTGSLNSLENVNMVTAEERSIPPSHPEAPVMTDITSDLSSTLESSLEGLTQEVTTIAQEAAAALTAVTLPPAPAQGTGAASLPQETSGEDTQVLSAPGATQMLTAAGTSTVKTPGVEDLTDMVLVTGEKAVPSPGGLLATQSGQTEEPSSKTMVPVTPASVTSSVRRTALPVVRKISTAVTYGLDRLESEGGAGSEQCCGECLISSGGMGFPLEKEQQ
ncbi:uncharacterized protein C14orf37 homolog isoform X5 [Numida meleagris]|uniref:uncharacterized protein C14orf37 homolog isoform X5 n=1 Tax=Numida meleagris TaxID=8996 RepID=UPI000B3DAF58|nr:uncharacterized protein C14orf37 homolog isoform X5 [Numida meleagris]